MRHAHNPRPNSTHDLLQQVQLQAQQVQRQGQPYLHVSVPNYAVLPPMPQLPRFPPPLQGYSTTSANIPPPNVIFTQNPTYGATQGFLPANTYQQ